MRQAPGRGPAWWEDWEPSAEERRSAKRPRARKAWEAPADSDSQHLADLSVKVRADSTRGVGIKQCHG